MLAASRQLAAAPAGRSRTRRMTTARQPTRPRTRTPGRPAGAAGGRGGERDTAFAAATVCTVSPSTSDVAGCHRRSSRVPADNATVPVAGSRNAHSGAVPGPGSPATTSPTPTRPSASPTAAGPMCSAPVRTRRRGGCEAAISAAVPPARRDRSRSPRPADRPPGSTGRERRGGAMPSPGSGGGGPAPPTRAPRRLGGTARPGGSSRQPSGAELQPTKKPELHSTTSAAAAAASVPCRSTTSGNHTG